jgi:magnesium-transporting ATPase (P-type)
MDSLGSLALATEGPTSGLLKRKPYGRTKPLISLTMARNIIGHAIFQLALLLTFLFAGKSSLYLFKFDFIGHKFLFITDGVDGNGSGIGRLSNIPNQHFTIIFNTFVSMTQFNELCSRRIHDERNIFSVTISLHLSNL